MRKAGGTNSGSVANIYAPTGKLCGYIKLHRLQILHQAYEQTLIEQPALHKQYGNLDFPTAIARLLNRYTNKHGEVGNKTQQQNQCTTPDDYLQAMIKGLGITCERFASPLNFNASCKSYFSMYAEDRLFGSKLDAYSTRWLGASQANPEYEAVAMEKAVRWAIFSALDTVEPVLTAFVLPCQDNSGTSYARWMTHPLVQEVATVQKNKFKFKDPRHWTGDKEYSGTP